MLDEDEGTAVWSNLSKCTVTELLRRFNNDGFARTNVFADPQSSADSDAAMKELYKGIRELWPRDAAVLTIQDFRKVVQSIKPDFKGHYGGDGKYQKDFKDIHIDRLFWLVVPSDRGRMTEAVFIRALCRLFKPPSDFSFTMQLPKSAHMRRYIFGEQPKSAAAAVTVIFNALYNENPGLILYPFYGDISLGQAEEILASGDGGQHAGLPKKKGARDYPHAGPAATDWLLRLAETRSENGLSWGVCLILSLKYPVKRSPESKQEEQHIPLTFQDKTMCGFVGDLKDGVQPDLKFLPDFIEKCRQQFKAVDTLYKTRVKERAWVDNCGALNPASLIRCHNCDEGWRPPNLLVLPEVKNGLATNGWKCPKCRHKNTERDLARCFKCKELPPQWWMDVKANRPFKPATATVAVPTTVPAPTSSVFKVTTSMQLSAIELPAVSTQDLLKLSDQGDPYAALVVSVYHFHGLGGLPQDFKTSQSYLERAARSLVDNIATVVAKAVLDLSGGLISATSVLGLVCPGHWFAQPIGGATVGQQRMMTVHCWFAPRGEEKSKKEQVSLVLIQDRTTEAVRTRLTDLVRDKGPRFLAINVQFSSNGRLARVPCAIVVNRAQHLFDEGKRLRATKPVEGTKLIAEAAKLNLLEAELEYAESLLVGRGVDADQIEAILWFRKAAEHKDDAVIAQYRLGYVLEDPTTVDNNPMEAARWLERAAQAGHVDALFRLGRMRLEGRGVEVSVRGAAELLSKAAFPKDDAAKGRESMMAARLLYVGALDRLGELKESLRVLEQSAIQDNSYSQLQFGWRYQLGIGTPADAVKARNWLTQAAKDKVRPTDNDPAVLVAKALLANDYESMPQDKQATLVRGGIDFEGPMSIGTDNAGRRTIECTMITRGSSEKPRVSLVCVEVKADEVNRYVAECISLPTAEDPTTQPWGVAMYVDLLDSESGLREIIPFALITPAVTEDKPTVPVPKEPSAESQRIVIMRSGHHTNNWLAVLGDIDKIMPTLLKYLNRDWKRDIAERNSGLEWLPQRLHLSLGKPAFGDVYVGKIGVGCACWMYIILSTPPPTLRPEIHTVFPVIVAKARKFYLRVKQILEWHNRIEATMISEIEYTTDDECKAAVGPKPVPGQFIAMSTTATTTLSASGNASSTKPNSSAPSAMDTTPERAEPILAIPQSLAADDGLNSSTAAAAPKPSTTFPLFAIDFVSRRNIWEGKGILEVFASGIAFFIVRNPQESLHIQPRRTQFEGWSKDAPSVSGGLDFPDDDDDEKKRMDTQPRSVVPDIAGPHGKTFPWSHYKDVRGIIVNEGPRKENRICYVQGICVRTIQLAGTIWGKSAYMVTVRIDEEKKIDLDVWCLLKHMMDGRATIVPGEYMTVNAGSVPQPGDLVFADVWIHGTIATGLDPVPTSGTLVTASSVRPKDSDMQE